MYPFPSRKFRVVIPNGKDSFITALSKNSLDTSTDPKLKKEPKREVNYQAIMKVLIQIFDQLGCLTTRYVRASTLANEIENIIFQQCCKDNTSGVKSITARYLTKCFSLVGTLNKNTNPDLPLQLYLSTISASQLLNMKPYDFLEENQKYQFQTAFQKTSQVKDYSADLFVTPDGEITIDENIRKTYSEETNII